MLTAEQYNLLRQKVEAEVERRNACGSLAAYGNHQRIETEPQEAGGAEETEQPEQAEAGTGILARQGKRVIEPLLAIQDYGDLVFPEPGEGIPASFEESLITYVNELSTESMTGTATSCRGACTGLCLGGCSNACSGCRSSCTGCGGCSASCGTGCAGGARA